MREHPVVDDELWAGLTEAPLYELTLEKFIDHAARWHQGAEVVTGGGEGHSPDRISYPALRDRAMRLSSALLGLGIAPRQRIATLAWNSQGHMEMWYAAFGIGISCHTLNPRLSVDHLTDMVRSAGDRLLAVSPDQTAVALELRRRCPSIETIVVLHEPGATAPILDGDDGRVLSYDELLRSPGPEVQWGGVPERAEAALCFTSGTTGAPKGVPYTHRCNYLVTLSLLQGDVMGITSRDVILAAVPMFHANGWGLPLAAPAAGAKLVFSARHNDGPTLARLIREEGVTLAVGVPTVWLGLIEHLEATGGTLPTLQRVLLGGSGVPQSLIDRIESRLGVKAQTSWGMTELAPLGTVTPPGNKGVAAIAGRPPIGVDLRLFDADGAPLPNQRGFEGHLRVRGSSSIERYFMHDERAADSSGWFSTGDLAVIDASGNLSITGRAKDLIKSGGEWINPVDIESIIGALPGVSLVAVVGRADPKWTERPILFVEGPDLPSDDDLRDALDGRIPRWWMPDAIERLTHMPLASTGKIDKQALRRLIAS